ncbi:M61 family metallopeptidase [Colwellia sp. 20A7]|uniref:M61 family metallopeptidase n=1 Tax=Colwellia sp. 20A7 TaxID=2689569 RepID=UPI0013570C61|nr:hypothetical protein [Colwellia sp. 20A7]
MKKIIILILYILLVSNTLKASESESLIKYSISQVSSNTLSIELEFEASTSKVQLIIPDRFGSTKGAGKGIKELNIHQEGCTFSNDFNKLESFISISPCSERPVKVTYFLTQIKERTNTTSNIDQFLPSVDENKVRWINGLALIVPWLSNEEINVKLSFSDAFHKKIYSSNMIRDGNDLIFNGNPNEFMLSFLYITDDSKVNSFNVNNNIELVSDKELKQLDPVLIDKINKAITVVSNQFSSFSSNFVLAFTTLNNDDNSHSLSGVALTNTYWIQATETEPESNLVNSMMHEFIHSWNPNSMGEIELNNLNLQWFVEGFTEYAALQLSLDSNIISRKEFNSKINEALVGLVTSDFSKLTSVEYTTLYNSSPIWLGGSDSFYRVPYWKGVLLALYWDEKLRSQNRKLTIFNLFDKLSSPNFLEEHPKLNEESIISALDEIGLEHAGKDINEFIFGNKGVNNTLDRYSELIEPISLVNFELGFDYLLTEKQFNTISGLTKESNAFRSGLRNGDILKEISFRYGHHDHEIEVILDDGAIYRYFPLGKVKSFLIDDHSIIPLKIKN